MPLECSSAYEKTASHTNWLGSCCAIGAFASDATCLTNALESKPSSARKMCAVNSTILERGPAARPRFIPPAVGLVLHRAKPSHCTDPPAQHGSVERSCSSDTAMTKETPSPWTHRKEYSRNGYPTARLLCRCEFQIAAEGVRQLHLPGRLAFGLKNLR